MRTVAQWTAGFRSGDLSPVEAAEACLARIDAVDGDVGAYVTVTPEVAQEAARASAARWRRGEPLSPLDGVPLAMKDLSATAGVRTTLGSQLFADFVPDFDVAYWARLKAAGAVLVGKTNTPEFGAIPTTENRLGPPTRNPWDLSRTAGGSSGGAAAALATGTVPVAEGSDGAGSIRIPSSCCGVVGIKPTRGRVSEGPLFGEQMGGLATSGPMARTVEDCLTMLSVMQGADPGDPYAAAGPPATTSGAQRVGLVVEAPHGPVEPPVRAAVERVAAELEALGVAVEPVTLPLEGFREALTTVWSVGMAAVPVADLDALHPVVRLEVEKGRQVGAVAYERARVRLHRRSRQLRVAMAPYDAVLLPVLTTPPKPLGFLDGATDLDAMFDWLPYTFPFNATGQPAVALPGGTADGGLPVGVQLVGRLNEDERLAALAARWEAARGLPHPVPPAFASG